MSVRIDTERSRETGVRELARVSVEGDAGADRILIVDDHDLFRQTLALVLDEHAGFGEKDQARSVNEARRAIGEPGGKPRLVIVDLDLGNGPVYELLEELREAGVAVLALTTSRDTGLRDRALRSGADEVHTTAASIGEIIAAARRLVGAGGDENRAAQTMIDDPEGER